MKYVSSAGIIYLHSRDVSLTDVKSYHISLPDEEATGVYMKYEHSNSHSKNRGNYYANGDNC